MITTLRRIATTTATIAIIAGTGAGIASATPAATAPAQTGWQQTCHFDKNFNWHFFNTCDRRFWHGSHHNDWNRHREHNRNFDYNWNRH